MKMTRKYIVTKTTIPIEFNVIADSLMKKKIFKPFFQAILKFCVCLIEI